MAFQGIFVLCPCFAGGSRSPPSPASIFLAGDFLYTKFCVQTRVKPPPLGFSRAVWAESPPMGGDLSARKARARPPCADAGGRNILHHRAPANQTTGATRAEGRGRSTRRGKRSAHAQTAGGKAETAGTQGRAPRAQPTATNGSRARERGPLPPLKFPAGCDPKGSTKGGRGERPAGAAGEGGHAPAKPSAAPRPTANQTPEQPPTTAPGGAPRGGKRGAKPDDSPPRGRKTERGQRPSRQADDGETASGRGSRPTPPHATARDHASGRRHGGETDGDGAGRADRTREPSRRPAASAEKHETGRQHARGQHGGREPRRPRAAARTHARAGTRCANAQTASEQRAQRANARKAGGRAEARTRPPREAAGAAARPPPSQTPRAARTQRAARPIVARRCGHFRADGRR